MQIGIDTISAYVIGIIFAIVLIYFMLKSAQKITFILLNVLFGGALFIILNIFNLQLPVNFLTVLLTCLLGVPGVILIIIMKFVLGVL
ncbi:MAG: pro-sigmaK processing inhibitor BofA family protein [Clostridia bacterium]|nr:pro-sigmaK processing inhibitor BofA family protein [Clostridia bacterium]